MTPDRAAAAALDAVDPLARFREQFSPTDLDFIYMDGNSLGRLPRETSRRIADFVAEEWGRNLVRGWDAWMDICFEVGDMIAGLIGASRGEVVVADSTSVNLYRCAHAALSFRPGNILTDAANFPSDRYILAGLASQLGVELILIDEKWDRLSADVIAPYLDEGVGLVSFSLVDYRTSAMADLKGITRLAHQTGALVLWDLCHAAGAVPIDLNREGVDLAVGCTYKYLNGGPGAPAFLYVRADLQDRLVQPIWGWFGHADQFGMPPDYVPAAGLRRFLVGTPPLLSIMAIASGVRLISEAGIQRLRDKSLAQTQMMFDLHDAWLAPLGFSTATPRADTERGSHVAFSHPDAWRMCSALIQRYGVIPDFREPDIVRFATAPIYTSFVDVWDAMDRLREVTSKGAYLDFPIERGRVT